jgi:hypothetical protein
LYGLDDDSGVLELKFIVIDCCSRVDEDADRVGLPYCIKSEWWFKWLLL